MRASDYFMIVGITLISHEMSPKVRGWLGAGCIGLAMLSAYLKGGA